MVLVLTFGFDHHYGFRLDHPEHFFESDVVLVDSGSPFPSISMQGSSCAHVIFRQAWLSCDEAQEACHENQFLVNAAYFKEARSTSCFQELSQTSQVLGCPLMSLDLCISLAQQRCVQIK
jgi:hypothetical protein